MPLLTRRSFARQSAALFSAASLLSARSKFTKNNLGVQLYTVRNTIGKDPLSVLRRIEEIGYTEIEATYGNLNEIWPALKQTSLRPVSVHIDEQIFRDGGNKLDQVLADAKQKGFTFAVVPYVAPDHRGGADTFKSLADILNKSGEKAKVNGLRLCYHNHAFEYESFNGKTGLQMLMDDTDKKLVSLELDIFWVTVGGNNPVDLLKRYSGRIALLHLKDKSKDFTATQYNEKVPKETFKEIGNGSINIPAVLKAAEAEGVEHFFVEQDQTSGDPLDSLQASYKYLSGRFS